MKMFLLSDNTDTATGLRLAGIEGTVIHTKDEVLAELENAKNISNLAILLITAPLMELAEGEITTYINENSKPVVLIVPDRHGKTTGSGKALMASTLGIK